MIPLGAGRGLTNLEGHTDFDIVWPWHRPGGLRRGATAVLRVKNEAPRCAFVLPPLLRACDHVLLVDNDSTDGTGEAAAVAAEHGRAGDRFTLKDYPFDVARAGAEHLAAHERRVHSLAYFYNWCFSHVRTRYTWKWDGDMVLTTEGEVSMADLSWQVGTADAVIRFPRHGLYLEYDRHAFLDLGLRNIEEWGFPMTPDFVYTKAPEWEIRTTPDVIRLFALPAGPVRRAEVPRRRRVRPLDRPGVVRHQRPQPPQAAGVAGLQRPEGGHDPRGRHRDQRARGRARRRLRDPRPGCRAPRARSPSTTPSTPSCTCAPEPSGASAPTSSPRKPVRPGGPITDAASTTASWSTSATTAVCTPGRTVRPSARLRRDSTRRVSTATSSPPTSTIVRQRDRWRTR